MNLRSTINRLFDLRAQLDSRSHFGPIATHRSERLRNGKLHCADAPALIVTAADDDRLLFEAWYLDGNLHRGGDEPALTRFDPTTGNPTETSWYLEGKLHRENGPAVIIRPADDPHAVLVYRRYCHGKLHAVGGLCAERVFDPDSREWLQQSFYEDGILVGGPIYNREVGRLNRLLNSP